MLTYQVRPRVFRIDGNAELVFPANGEICFYFSPGQPFGTKPGGGRTAVQNVAASALFNANSGRHEVESKTPLSPLEVMLVEGERTIRLVGDTLRIAQGFTSNRDLTELIDGVYFAIPMLLAVDYADPPIISRVDGKIGEAGFRWELSNWKGRFEITTQERQERAFGLAWERLHVLSKPGSRRLLAALHYFHVALRLAARGEIAGEFLPEMILNLSKVLEALFPPSGDGRTRDAVRSGLRALGFADIDIEADYIPAMALRNEIDVGHVDLSLFKPQDLAMVHGYAEYAEVAFKRLFKRIFERLDANSWDIPPHEPTPAEGEAVRIIERLRQHAERYAC